MCAAHEEIDQIHEAEEAAKKQLDEAEARAKKIRESAEKEAKKIVESAEKEAKMAAQLRARRKRRKWPLSVQEMAYRTGELRLSRRS
jgi:vacuolar-type H+-ATPase subunit H